jgi:hypothetical protein
MTRAAFPRLASGLVALCLAAILSFSASHAHADACKEPKAGTDDVPLFSNPVRSSSVKTLLPATLHRIDDDSSFGLVET